MPRINTVSTRKQDTVSNPPLPEPPPTTDNVELQEWVNDVCNSIMDKTTMSHNNNDEHNLCKPTITKLCFDDELQSARVQKDIDTSYDNIPIECTYDNASAMDF